jgi:hypothetical protein
MGLLAGLLKTNRKVKEVMSLAGPTSRGGATMNVYLYHDDEMETVEFDWLGREIVRYLGEPRAVPPGIRMPDPPPRPRGAAPLPPPVSGNPPAPAAPLEAAPPARGSRP